MFQLHHQPWLRVNYEDNNCFLSHFCKRSSPASFTHCVFPSAIFIVMVKSTLKRQYSQALGKSTQVANKGKGGGVAKNILFALALCIVNGCRPVLVFCF